MNVLCTNGLKSVLLEILPGFERVHGTRVDVTWGSAAGLMQQLEAGAPADLVILTAEAIDDLIARDKVIADSRRDLARSGIGIAIRCGTPKPDIATPEALRRTLLAARSVAHSRTGMSGIYFPTVLERLGIAAEMKPRIVTPEPGTPVGELIADGRAELGVQQVSELLPVAGIEVAGSLPASLQRTTIFTAGVLATASEAPAARALVQHIASESRLLMGPKGLEPA